MQWVVEDCLCLDANRLAKAGWFGDGIRMGSIKWDSGAAIGLQFRGPAQELDLNYNLDGESNHQTVRVSKRPCHFGGYRHYFHCPGCGSRRYKLHCAHSGFYCRDCYRLPYYSQECGYLDGLIRKMHRLEAKLENLPKHTRTKTVDRLEAKLEELEWQWSGAILARVGEFEWRRHGLDLLESGRE